MSKHRIVLAAAAAALGFASVAHADDSEGKHAGTVIVNLRVTDVAPQSGAAIVTSSGAATGLAAHVSDDVIPSLGISYFLTDHVAAELILGASFHEIRAVGASTDAVVRKTWVLPPTLSLQYHFAPKSAFSPYVGAGVNYMLFFNGHDYNGFTVGLHNGFGLSLQGGADIAVTKKAYLNLDVKKIFFSTDANINGGAYRARVNLDPWVVSAGVGLKF